MNATPRTNHITAHRYHGLSKVVTKQSSDCFLARAPSSPLIRGVGTALHQCFWAARKGHSATFKVFLDVEHTERHCRWLQRMVILLLLNISSVQGGETSILRIIGAEHRGCMPRERAMRVLSECCWLASLIKADTITYGRRAALSYAAENGHALVCELLLEATGGNAIAASVEDNWGRTLLSYAVVRRHDDVIKLLLPT